MKNILGLAVALCVTASPASAAMIEATLGEQDFMNGFVFALSPVPDFNTASSGEAAPFDVFRGSDIDDNFDESWMFAYAAIVNPLEQIVSAALLFGIVDHDSMHPGSQIASFLMDGNDLKGELDPLFESSGGATNEYNTYLVPLPSAVFADLRDGNAMFSLALQGPTPGLFSPLAANGAGLDFAKLTIETRIDDGEPPPSEAPVPSTALLLIGGGLGWLASRRRRT